MDKINVKDVDGKSIREQLARYFHRVEPNPPGNTWEEEHEILRRGLLGQADRLLTFLSDRGWTLTPVDPKRP